MTYSLNEIQQVGTGFCLTKAQPATLDVLVCAFSYQWLFDEAHQG